MLYWLHLALSAFFLLQPSQIAAFKVTGANDSDGSLPVRLEINKFATIGPAFDLYILALQEFQSVNQTDPLSYFQIAGIHGYPVTPWDGVVGTGTYPGYCMHACTLFPIWHRPYVALFEQIIWTHAQAVAGRYPLSQRLQYQNAATTLRVPFWDWAIHPALPDVVTSPNISVNTPNGFQSIKNPLYRYDFHPGPEGNGFPNNIPLSAAPYTTRWADADLKQSNEAAATTAMLSNAANILSTTYQLLASVTDYTQFSCTWPGGHTNGANNIEQIHNNIHNNVGGVYGSMTWPEVAAFDPIFWLHHAQVDRLITLWQVLNPSTYVVPTVNAYGSYFEQAGALDTIDSGLAPFHSNSGSNLFTPRTVQDAAAFGYTYPELTDLTGNGTTDQANLRAAINALYNTQAASQSEQFRSETKRATSVAQAFGCVTLQTAQELGVNNLDRQWSIRVTYDYHAYVMPISIDFFMGPPPAEPATWSSAENLVGTYSQFASAETSIRYHNDGQAKIEGELSLTHTLAAGVSRGFLQDLSPQQAVPILEQHLTWRVRAGDNQEIGVDSISGLSITVLSRAVLPSQEACEFPTYGEYEMHLEVTNGKAGGSQIA